jgi:hypothetical protein
MCASKRSWIAVALLALAVTVAPPAFADYACLVTGNGVLPYNDGALNVLRTGRGD